MPPCVVKPWSLPQDTAGSGVGISGIADDIAAYSNYFRTFTAFTAMAGTPFFFALFSSFWRRNTVFDMTCFARLHKSISKFDALSAKEKRERASPAIE